MRIYRWIIDGVVYAGGFVSRLTLVSVMGIVAGGVSGEPVLVPAAVIGVYLAAEISLVLGGSMMDAQRVAAFLFSLLWWPTRGRLGLDCPFCGLPILDANSRPRSYRHMALCDGEPLADELAIVHQILPPEIARLLLDRIDDDLPGYIELADYAEYMSNGRRPIAERMV